MFNQLTNNCLVGVLVDIDTKVGVVVVADGQISRRVSVRLSDIILDTMNVSLRRNNIKF